ncbi:MAG: hypothetical protein LBB67_07285 [Oscillospiraceae bacterium]|jgi:hypothetical protein|nr:hypothetical protein [Oscillospiraceae bacterium]
MGDILNVIGEVMAAIGIPENLGQALIDFFQALVSLFESIGNGGLF